MAGKDTPPGEVGTWGEGWTGDVHCHLRAPSLRSETNVPPPLGEGEGTGTVDGRNKELGTRIRRALHTLPGELREFPTSRHYLELHLR